MLSGNALRHQIILPEQQRFYDYWRSKCKGGVFPSRHDILPEDIVGQLTMTSLLDVETGAEASRRFKYRLAGTGFWNLYQDEIQGQYVDELPLGDRCTYWDRVLGLPLSDNGTDINLILGYDHLVKMSDMPALQGAEQKQYA